MSRVVHFTIPISDLGVVKMLLVLLLLVERVTTYSLPTFGTCFSDTHGWRGASIDSLRPFKFVLSGSAHVWISSGLFGSSSLNGETCQSVCKRMVVRISRRLEDALLTNTLTLVNVIVSYCFHRVTRCHYVLNCEMTKVGL